LESYYGTVDPVTKRVTIRRLSVPINCTKTQILADNSFAWDIRKPIWVWDWGRTESPTESQIRNIERETGCIYNDDLRYTLNDVYQQAKKNNVAFADLIDQKIKTAMGLSEPTRNANTDNDGSKRRRRH
jgi:hypothetical protein